MIGVLLIPKRLSHRRPPVTHSKTVDSTIHASTPWIRLLRGLSGEPGWDKISSNLGSQKSIFGVPILSHLYENPQINTTQRGKKTWLKDASSSIREFSELRVRCLRTPSAGPDGADGAVGLEAMATGGESWPKISMEDMPWPKMDQNTPVIPCDMAIWRRKIMYNWL